LTVGSPISRIASPRKARTIYQPCAALIVNSFKHYEIRSWQTKIRVRIAIRPGRRVGSGQDARLEE
jgi:hypothetical protein